MIGAVLFLLLYIVETDGNGSARKVEADGYKLRKEIEQSSNSGNDVRV